MMQQLAATVMGQSQAIHSLAGAHQQLQSHVQGIADDMNAPTQIIRDEDGVPTHIKKGRNMRPVSLDANGRLTGA